MHDGIAGIHGNGGTLESVSYRFHWRRESSNPTLSANITSVAKTVYSPGNFGCVCFAFGRRILTRRSPNTGQLFHDNQSRWWVFQPSLSGKRGRPCARTLSLSAGCWPTAPQHLGNPEDCAEERELGDAATAVH